MTHCRLMSVTLPGSDAVMRLALGWTGKTSLLRILLLFRTARVARTFPRFGKLGALRDSRATHARMIRRISVRRFVPRGGLRDRLRRFAPPLTQDSPGLFCLGSVSLSVEATRLVILVANMGRWKHSFVHRPQEALSGRIFITHSDCHPFGNFLHCLQLIQGVSNRSLHPHPLLRPSSATTSADFATLWRQDRQLQFYNSLATHLKCSSLPVSAEILRSRISYVCPSLTCVFFCPAVQGTEAPKQSA